MFNACNVLINLQIVPAIKEKWPPFLSKNIRIQQDNCRAHISQTDAEFNEVANTDGFHMELVQQPAQSPDCNALDLGFFNAIQSLQQRKKCRNADELILAVEDSFKALEPMTLNKVFLSLQCVLKEIMKLKGGNDYKQPHMQKNALIREGRLPGNLEVQEHVVRDCIDHLIKEDYTTAGIEDLMAELGINAPYNGNGGDFDLNN